MEVVQGDFMSREGWQRSFTSQGSDHGSEVGPVSNHLSDTNKL